MIRLDVDFDCGIRCHLKKQELFRRQVTVPEIAKIIGDTFEDAICVASPTYMGIIDVYLTTGRVEEVQRRCDEEIIPALLRAQ